MFGLALSAQAEVVAAWDFGGTAGEAPEGWTTWASEDVSTAGNFSVIGDLHSDARLQWRCDDKSGCAAFAFDQYHSLATACRGWSRIG
jgi:hypothetical protein